MMLLLTLGLKKQQQKTQTNQKHLSCGVLEIVALKTLDCSQVNISVGFALSKILGLKYSFNKKQSSSPICGNFQDITRTLHFTAATVYKIYRKTPLLESDFSKVPVWNQICCTEWNIHLLLKAKLFFNRASVSF